MLKCLRLPFQSAQSQGPEVPSSLNIYTSPFHIFDSLTGSWLSSSNETRTLASAPHEALHILTWNVDFVTPNPPLRMRTLLAHLHLLLGEGSPSIIILFQEVHQSALNFLLTHTWVRNNFAVTDTVIPHRSGRYGTITLIAKCLVPSISCCFRAPFNDSVMGRDALFVDFRVVIPQPTDTTSQHRRERGGGGAEGTGIFRVGNTHLESLQLGTAIRPAQLTIVRDILAVPGVYAGVVGGDMNAIASEDEELPQRIGMRDLWVGQEGERGETWGYQPPCEYPPGRLDKILVIGNAGLAGNNQVEPVGVGLKTELDENEDAEECFVSDHYGLLGVIQLKHV